MQDEVWKVICNSLGRLLIQFPELGLEMERGKIAKANVSPNAALTYLGSCPGAGSAIKAMLPTQDAHPMTSDIHLIPPTHPHLLSLVFSEVLPLTIISELVGLSQTPWASDRC